MNNSNGINYDVLMNIFVCIHECRICDHYIHVIAY